MKKSAMPNHKGLFRPKAPKKTPTILKTCSACNGDGGGVSGPDCKICEGSGMVYVIDSFEETK